MAEPLPGPHLRLEMLSQARFLSAARAMVANLAQRLGFNEIECGQISLAVDEALCNVINHGYHKREDGMIWMSMHVLEPDPVGIRIVIEDEADQVDPEIIQPRDLDDIRPGGLGVYIIREIMDEVRYEKRSERGMRLTLVKWLPGEDDAAEQSPSATRKGNTEP